MKKQAQIFFTALMFYTRLPCPKWVDHSAEMLNRATRYFPLIGWIVGSLSVGVLIASQHVFGAELSLILSLTVSVLVTGAFHEDGFADVCDGFGGGWTKEKILEIMKDSRLGTFGAVGLLLIFLAKVFLLKDILFARPFDPVFAALLFISSHSLSRFIASTFIITHVYVRENEDSKAKPVAKTFHRSDFFVAAIFGTLPLIFLAFYAGNAIILIVFPIAYLTKVLLGGYFKKWIGGYTGDCLGATQQVTEIIFLASLLIIWKFI